MPEFGSKFLVSKNQLILDMIYTDGTYSVWENGNPKSGYVVAIKKYDLRYSDDLDYLHVVETVEFFVKSYWDWLIHANELYFGRWLDTETNHVYLDIVRVFDNEAEAAEFAKSQGEIAYYDLANNREVRV